MNNIKVTQLSIEEVKKKIYDNDIEDMYVLYGNGDLFLHSVLYCKLGHIIEYMSDGSAFLKIEVIKDDDRTEE